MQKKLILFFTFLIVTGCFGNKFAEISKYREEGDVYSLVIMLDSWNTDDVCNAANALGKIKDPVAVNPLINKLSYSIKEERYCFIRALVEIGEPSVEPLIMALNVDSSAKVRESAAVALGLIKDKRAVEALIFSLSDKKRKVREAAHKALMRITKKRYELDSEEWYKLIEDDKNKLGT